MKTSLVVTLAVVAAGSTPSLRAQSAGPSTADGPVLAARAVEPTAVFNIFNPAGTLRLIGWDRDSIVVCGHTARGQEFAFTGGSRGMKIGILDQEVQKPLPPSDFVIYLPRRSTVSPKTVSADISATDVSGTFYSVSGTIRLRGSATSIDAESMNGSVDVDVAAPWVHVRTGEGHLLVRGTPQDVDASTIGGTLDIASPAILRGRFSSVSGDIHYVGSPAAGGIFEFSNHSGAVDFLFPRTVSAKLELSSVVGLIENGFVQVRPVAAGPHSLHINLGHGDSQITARTFKGVIRLRPEQ
jgi:hypothetical protein